MGRRPLLGRLVHGRHLPRAERIPAAGCPGHPGVGRQPGVGYNSGALPTRDLPNTGVHSGVTGSGGVGTAGGGTDRD